MSEMKRFIMDRVESGGLKFSDLDNTYEHTALDTLLDEKERLEYEIWASKRDLRKLIRKINKLTEELGL